MQMCIYIFYTFRYVTHTPSFILFKPFVLTWQDSSSPSKRTSRHYLDGLIGRSSSSIHLESTVEKVCDREDEDDNDDDDLPLSSFVPTKPPPAVDTESKPLPPPAASTMATAPRYCPCSKPAVIDPRWDGQYCSVECLVRSCREAFGVWVDQKSDSGGAIRTNNIAV